MNKVIQKKNEIFFSINICCYNSANYIEETLESIINQSFKNWEIVVVDDGSTDKTLSILENYKKLIKNLKIIVQKNQGLAIARNTALKNSNCNWIVIIDHDDILKLDRLKNQYENIIQNANSKLFFGDVMLFGDGQSKKNRFYISRHVDKFDPVKINLKKNYAYQNLVKYGCFISSSSVVFNKYCAIKIGLFDPKFKFIVDYIFFMEFAKKYDLYCSNNIISKVRIHKNQSTKKMKRIYFVELNNLYWSFYYSKIISFRIKIIVIIKNLRLLISLFKN